MQSFTGYLARLENQELLSIAEVSEITQKATLILMREPNIVHTLSPCIVVGDIHGQFFDLLNIFHLFGKPPKSKYIFLGDYVDRGHQSLETILTLLLLKILHPKHIILLRGNHETTTVKKDLGFYSELTARYASQAPEIRDLFASVFRFLPPTCLIDGRSLCLHGGLSPLLNTLSGINTLDRVRLSKAYSDILWSDPSNTSGFNRSTRGLGYFFGPDIANTFLSINDLFYLIRGHQYMKEGFKIHFQDKNVITVWSAPRYMYFFDNVASVLFYTGKIQKKGFKVFKDVHAKHNQQK